jgi:predicted alpha/beta superfamily hydrolase
MKKKLAAVLLAVLVTSIAWPADTQFMQGLGDVRYHRVASEAVGRAYHIYVSLPEGYGDTDGHYPTVYLLDGGNTFPMLVPYYRYLNFGEEAPKMIMVGISYASDNFEDGNFRSTDYTAPSDEREYWGGAAAFQAFLGGELFSLIEREYRSDATRRIIFGQSIGGQFVLFTALTQPRLFWGHIASNPALHRNLSFFLEEHADYGGPTQSKLFVASGTEDDPVFRQPAMEWIQYWQDRHAPWQLETIDLEGHSHMSAPPAAFRQGLRWLFGE